MLLRFRSRSSVKTRWRLCRGLAGTARLVAAPGREIAPEKLADLESFASGGDTTTGPPNLLLIVAHRSGRRAEKLRTVRLKEMRGVDVDSQGADHIDTEVSKNIVRMLGRF